MQPRDWRRAAHRCADAIFSRLTGEGGYFDTRIVYVSETGPARRRVKRLAIMDYDGANHRFLTNGQWTVLTPRFAPNQQTITYMTYENERPRVMLYTLDSGQSRPLIQSPNMTFAPRYSPDSRYIIFSMAVNGNTDVYRVPVAGGTPQRLTNAPGIDTGGSYSPDGNRIVFESDRGGSQQLYLMDADGSNQRRISFGGGGYGTPVWSPRGDLIAFTKTGGFRIGVMAADGSGERILTGGSLRRRADLGAERPGGNVHPRRQPGPALVCRCRLGRDAAGADPVGRLGPGLVAAARLNFMHEWM